MADKELKSIKFPGLPNRYLIPKISDIYSEKSSDGMSGKAVKQAIDAVPRGITPDLKTALLQIAEKVAYIDEHGTDYYQNLYDALYPEEVTVTNNLTGCISNNSATRTELESPYTAAIVANTGYMMAGATVSIRMGGADITSSAYSNGIISIASVTGDLVITISAVAVVLSSIDAVFNQGQTVYDTDNINTLKSMLTVTAIYSDSSTVRVPNSDYTLSGTLTAGVSTITVSFGGKTDTFSVTVTHASGTYSISNSLSGCTNSNSATSITEGDSYSATITAESGYTLVGATVAITMGGIDVTSTAYSNGAISIDSVTGSLVIEIAASEIALSSIDATFNQGTNVIYDTDTLDSLKQYLVVTANYTDGTSRSVSDYTLSGTLAVGTSTITVSYGGKTATFNVTVTHQAVTYSITNNLTNCTNSNGATAVTEGNSYSGTITANSGYTMIGATVSIIMGGTDITSTAYNNGAITIASVSGNIVINASAVAVTLSSISAVFTQGQTVIYDTDSLDVLKPMLVVTATYSDSSTATIPSTDYALIGTLSVGTSTITVSYMSKTDTFNVTVDGENNILRNWDFTQSLVDSVSGKTATTNATRDSNGVTFNAGEKYIDFDLEFSRDRTYEIDITSIGTNAGTAVYRRIFAFGENGTGTSSNTAALVFGRQADNKSGWWWYLGSAWDASPISAANYSSFDGKTLKIYIDNTGKCYAYTKTIGADDSTYISIGNSTSTTKNFTNGKVYIGGSSSDSLAHALIKGFRVYEGEK